VSAANAVCAGLREFDSDVRTQVVDSYKYAALVVSRVVSDGYLRMVKTIPQMYRYIYDRAERATVAGGFRKWAAEFTARNIIGLMNRLQPSVVVCTHAFPCGVMSAYKRLFDASPPVLGPLPPPRYQTSRFTRNCTFAWPPEAAGVQIAARAIAKKTV